MDVGLGQEFNPKSGFRSKPKSETTSVVKAEKDSLDPTGSSTQGEEKDRGRIKVFYYRESMPEPPKVRAETNQERGKNQKDGGHNSTYFDHIVPPTDDLATQVEGSILDVIMVLTL